MKKAISIILVLVMVFAIAACGKPAETPPASSPPAASSPAGSAPPSSGHAWNDANIGEHTFVLAHGMTAESQVGTQYHEFALAVEELSGGKMKIDEKIGGTLYIDTETFDALLDGTVDFIHSMGSYVSGTVKDIQPMTIAGYHGGGDWLKFAEDTHDLISSIYADYNIKFLGALYQSNSVICCNAKQIKVPDDVKGLTFRASGEWVSKTVSAWGGGATNIALPELADAFSKKTVDGVATMMGIIVPWKIYEVVKYITVTNITEGFAALLMNGDSWNKLNDDEKALIEEAGKVFEKKAYDIAVRLNDEYIETAKNSGRNELYYLTPEEEQQFIERAYSLYPEMEQSAGLSPKGLELIALLKQINGIA